MFIPIFIPTQYTKIPRINHEYEFKKVLVETLGKLLDVKLETGEITLQEWVNERNKHYEGLRQTLKS